MDHMDNQPGQSETTEQRRRILALVGRVERRVRLQRALERGTAGGVVYLMAMAVVVTLYSTYWIEWATLLSVGMMFAAVPVGIFMWGWFSRVDRVALAQRIDRANGLHDRLSTALSLLEAGKDDAFVRAQIRDAIGRMDQVDAATAAPFKRPADLAAFGIFLAAVALLSLFEPPSHIHPLPEPPVIEHDPVLTDAAVALERDRLEQMRKELDEIDDPEVEELIDEIDALLDDVEERKLSEKEFLERVDEIEKKFFDAQQEQATKKIAEKLKKAAEALEKEMGEELKKHEEVKSAVEALKNKDLGKAANAMSKLAEKLKNNELSEAEAERLADLLEMFADKIDVNDPELQALAEKHRDLFEKLSKKFNADGNLSSKEKQLLNREKKKLDALEKRRNSQARSKATRQLKSLRRATKDMAKKLNQQGQNGQNGGKKDGQNGEQAQKNGQNGQKGQKSGQQGQQSSPQQDAGRMAEKAAEALKKGSRQQKSNRVREQARRQLEEMKETMRRSSARRRNGDQESDAQSAENMRKFLERANGKKPGESGKASGKQGGAQKQGNKAGGKAPGESNQAGQGKGDRRLGEETDMASQAKDTKVDGRNAGGPSKSEIIKAASEKGFATTEYKDVYVDYESVVEEVMEREEVPAGYRYYIKRYFELIKPRE
jgi:hypothetical protein